MIDAPYQNIELKRMTLDDLEAYVELEKRTESRIYAAAQNRAEALEEFEQGPMYFIKQGETIVGSVSYSAQEDGSVYLNGIAIDPAFQGQGFARATLEQVLALVADAPSVWLVTHPENDRAISLFESFGFAVTGKNENHHGDGEPRIVLTRIQGTS